MTTSTKELISKATVLAKMHQGAINNDLREIAQRLRELEAQLAAVQKDADRYQWLRGRVPGGDYRVMGIIYSEGGEGVDAGIDAAMQPKEQL